MSLIGLCIAAAWLAPVGAADLETAVVASVDLPRLYRLDGVAEAVNQGTVSAQTSGRVSQVHVDVDDVVSKGDLIISLDDSRQQAGVRQAEASLRAARSRRADAEAEFRRIRGVFEKQAVSKAEMDKASAALEQARAGQHGAQAALLQAEQELSYTQIRAPYNGIVTERLIEVGEAAQPGVPLMSGISLDSMRVSVDVPQNLVESIREERRAQVLIRDEWLPVTDITVFPVADPRSDTFRVRLTLPEDVEGVFPGMYMKVGFVAGKRPGLVVPQSAVVLRSEVIGVYVVDPEGRVSLRHIRPGSPAGRDHLSVLSGLDAGERVAIDPVAAGIALKSQRQLVTRDE